MYQKKRNKQNRYHQSKKSIKKHPNTDDSDVDSEIIRRHEELQKGESYSPGKATSPALMIDISLFMKISNCQNAIFDESPTYRLLKALHEKKVQNVILAIEQGAQVDIKVSHIIYSCHRLTSLIRPYLRLTVTFSRLISAPLGEIFWTNVT